MWSRSITARGFLGSSLIWIIYASVALVWWLATLRLHSPVERSQLAAADLGERGQLAVDTFTGYSTFGYTKTSPASTAASSDFLSRPDLTHTTATSSSDTLVCTLATPKHAHLPRRGHKMFTVGSWREDEEDEGYRPPEDGR